MLTSYVKPAQHFVTCTNQDVVYGAGYMARDKEPIVFQVAPPNHCTSRIGLLFRLTANSGADAIAALGVDRCGSAFDANLRFLAEA